MRDAAAFLLLLIVVPLTVLPPSSSRAQGVPQPEPLAYTDPTGFLTLQLSERWERWSPETAEKLLADLAPWPPTTAIFSLALDPEAFRCPCVWVARLESGPDKVYLDAVERKLYPEAAFERVAGPHRPEPFTAKDERYFHDPGRGVLWGWQDHSSGSGAQTRMAILYVPTQTATAVLMFQATPELFDAHVGDFVQLLDSLEVSTRPGRVRSHPPQEAAAPEPVPAAAAAAEPAALPAQTRPLGAVLLLVLLFAGIYGICESGPVYALKCMFLVVISGSVFLGNFVVAVRGPQGADAPLAVHSAIGRGMVAALALPLLCAAIALWWRGKRSRIGDAWLIGSLLAGSLFLIYRHWPPA